MPSRLISDCDPLLQPLANQFIAQCNADPVFTSVEAKVFIDCTYRSNEEQAHDYAQGRTIEGKIITDEPPGHSAHNCTLEDGTTPGARAFDFAIELADRQLDWCITDPLWRRAVQIGLALGLVSLLHTGLGDGDHFELPNWRHLDQIA